MDINKIDIPCAGLISVVGKVFGRDCMIIANDATLKAEPTFQLL